MYKNKNENEKLRRHVQDLSDRLLAVVELTRDILLHPRGLRDKLPRLLADDYLSFLDIVKYYTEKSIDHISISSVSKLVLKNYNMIETETLLLNLQQFHMLKIVKINNTQHVYITEKWKFKKKEI